MANAFIEPQLYANLRAKAFQLRPAKRSDSILVGLYTVKDQFPDPDTLETGDFGWFTARLTTRISTLRRQADRIDHDILGVEDYIIKHSGREVDASDTVGSFDIIGDGFVFFIAVQGRLPFNYIVANSQPAIPSRAIKNEPIESSEVLFPGRALPASPSVVKNLPDTRGVSPKGFINPFVRYSPSTSRHASEERGRSSQSPAVHIKPDPAARVSPFPTRTSLFTPEIKSEPDLRSSPLYGLSNSQPPHHGQGDLHIRTPNMPQASPSLSQSMSMGPPSIRQPSREASVKSEVLDIIKNEFNDSAMPNTPHVQLQTMFKDVSVEIMEEGIKKGLSLLDKLDGSLDDAQGADAIAFKTQIANICKQAAHRKTVIGVVGNTGAGKSSVINALLDEERLVPTNCMRACTAVVTEISYNTETDGPYRAKIEFISEADWLKELQVLYQDLMDEYGEIKNVSRDQDASVAWAKIKAIYPRKTKENIVNSTPEQLVRDGSVQGVLGKTKVVEETHPLRFYKQLQRYVDSQEKKQKDDRSPKQMEFWPLIRVVRIFVKSPVLETGATIVDLPGVHDANSARAAVADSYMQKCTGLWIVAPITRAVDDKSAHKLLGDGFRRQLLMDGGFSSISFICSKADDISVSEAVLSLNLDDELEPQTEKIEELDEERKEKKEKLKDLQDTKSDMQDASDELDELLTACEDLKDKAEEGETVYAPKMKPKVDKNSKKRKRGGSPAKKSKKARRSSDDDESDNDEEEEEEEEEDVDKGDPITLEMIEEKIDELKATKKEGRKAKQDIVKQITKMKAEIAEFNEAIKKLEDEVACRCIAERNKYSTGAIQQDFAAGLRELDLEATEERDGENFDPNIDQRDYEEVANSLPVFCVSSRGYQKLQGRLKKDGDPPVFKDIEQTGMPALQSHCTKLTEKGRLANGRKFLTSVSQLCNSLNLWSSGASVNLSAAEKDQEVQRLDRKFADLDRKLDRGIESTISELKEEMKDSIFDRYADAVNSAAKQAPETVAKWGMKVNRSAPQEGGYYWSTYKALCRRDGVFTNDGPHDWNSQLTTPVIRTLAGNWERVFTRRVPHIIRKYIKTVKNSILSFHNAVTAQAGPGRAAHLHLLSGQLTTHGDAVQTIGNEAVEVVNVAQREINREFTPTVQQIMGEAYLYCVQERGPGSFMRMKAFMEQHVDTHKRSMFEKAVKNVKDKLMALMKRVEDVFDEFTALMYAEMQRDYHSIFGGEAQDFSGGQGRQVRDMKEKVQKALEGFQGPFRAVVGLEDEPTAKKEEEEAMGDQVMGEAGPSGSRSDDESGEEDGGGSEGGYISTA